MAIAQRAINNQNQSNSNNNRRTADAWGRPRIVVRNKKTGELVKHASGKHEGEIAKFWFTNDIPLYATNANGEPQPAVQRIIAKVEQDPEFEFEVQMGVKLPGQSEVDYDIMDF